MMAMPICDSIDSAKLWVKMSGSPAKISATATQNTILRAVSTGVMLVLRARSRISVAVDHIMTPACP